MGDYRVERERENCQNEKEEGGVHILTFCFIITNEFSIGNIESEQLLVIIPNFK